MSIFFHCGLGALDVVLLLHTDRLGALVHRDDYDGGGGGRGRLDQSLQDSYFTPNAGMVAAAAAAAPRTSIINGSRWKPFHR